MDPNLELYLSIRHLRTSERQKRLRHLPSSERYRVVKIIHREEWRQRLEDKIAGRDIVEMALANPVEIQESPSLQKALLGRACFPDDEWDMVTRITNSFKKNGDSLVQTIADFDNRIYSPLRIDVWKLVYCDLYHIDGSNTSLEDIYKRRLQEEELQNRTTRAREVARDNYLKKARRNAKWMIPALEKLSEDELSQPDEEFNDTL
ncbi:hypothetical protein IL306_004063 [Fusarium sp. DS 682]|nr:hypothetical protein IL306_004063 [Fusarium sp. DS 682]